MPLVFSPLNEDVLEASPRILLPKHAFVMRQLGAPPELDMRMSDLISETLHARGYKTVDATTSTGAKDYLERIVGLIRSTGFTVAIFSNRTRPTAMANICLELGFAAMCGKPVIITKSSRAKAPSDIKRTDWINFDPARSDDFRENLLRALQGIEQLSNYYRDTLVPLALNARSPDCAIALERANKAFLLSGNPQFIETAETILERLGTIEEGQTISDIERLRQEVRIFIAQARSSLQPPA